MGSSGFGTRRDLILALVSLSTVVLNERLDCLSGVLSLRHIFGKNVRGRTGRRRVGWMWYVE
jgi:hypothetical protein